MEDNRGEDLIVLSVVLLGRGDMGSQEPTASDIEAALMGTHLVQWIGHKYVGDEHRWHTLCGRTVGGTSIALGITMATCPECIVR